MKPVSPWLVAGVALAGIVNCASAQPAHPKPTGPPVLCNTGICKIEVKVNDCGTSGGITVNPPFLSLPGGPTPVILHWTIVPPTFKFAPDGIRFDPPNPQFHPLPGGPANQFRMRNDR